MLETVIAYTRAPAAPAASKELAAKISAEMSKPPDALILFASPKYDQSALVSALFAQVAPKVLVGASSAGEMTSQKSGEGMACALALRSNEMRFSAGIGRNVGKDRAAASKQIVSSFRGVAESRGLYRSALVLTDALAGHADDLVEQLTLATSGQYQFFGGGAGDDAQFRRTQVFFRSEATADAAVALEIISEKPVGVGVGHGWEAATPGMRVTEVRGTRLVSLNGVPAIEAFERHAQATGQQLDRSAPIPFFLHNILGIAGPDGHRLRVPLAVTADGSVDCAAEVPAGAVVHIMRTTNASAAEAAARAARSAMAGIAGHKPKTALFFDCVATRLRMGDAFGDELDALTQNLGGSTSFVGCNTHGQIARSGGQFGGFHNCTAVVCVLPE